MDDTLNILSLGAGVQSSALALMVAKGDIPPVECAIFADTQAEPKSVYDWLAWLESQCPFPIHRVTTGNLTNDSLTVRTSKKSGNQYLKVSLPVFLDNNGQKSISLRQCTVDYKISPINRLVRKMVAERLGRNPRRSDGKIVNMLIGISKDECHRMKPSRKSYIEHEWPLVDRNMTRAHCVGWMEKNGYPKPPRSACVYCPYHSNAEWLRLKTDEPDEFARAVAYEQAIQKAATETVLRGTPYLHSSLKPLSAIVFKQEKEIDLWGNECEGMCGV